MSYCNTNIHQYEGVGYYDIPVIQPVYELSVHKWIGFSDVLTTKQNTDDVGVHFFLDDYRFERFWNHPNKYFGALSRFGCILSPDFSLYTDMPKAVQIYNHYRKHWLAAYLQEQNLTVIPSICWSDESSFEWCFDGEPTNSIVAVSNVGCMKDENSKRLFKLGYEEMIKRLNPIEILFYAKVFDKNEYSGNIRRIVHNIGYTVEVPNDLGRA